MELRVFGWLCLPRSAHLGDALKRAVGEMVVGKMVREASEEAPRFPRVPCRLIADGLLEARLDFETGTLRELGGQRKLPRGAAKVTGFGNPIAGVKVRLGDSGIGLGGGLAGWEAREDEDRREQQQGSRQPQPHHIPSTRHVPPLHGTPPDHSSPLWVVLANRPHSLQWQ